MRRAVAVLLALLAVALLAVLVTGTYGMTTMYGFEPRRLQPIDAMIVLLLGGLAVLLLLAARGQAGARRPSTAGLVVTVLALFAGSTALSAVLGGAAHARRSAAVAGACSPDDRELLAAVEFSGYRDGPYGDPDGGCVLRLHPGAETETGAGTAAADLTAALQRDGWQPADSRGGTSTLERDGAAITLATVFDNQATEIVLTLR